MREHPASFRDPAGRVILAEGRILRRVHYSYREAYDLLRSSGLYQALVSAGLIVAAEEVEDPGILGDGYKLLAPEPVAFISYPYEWCFTQLREAALATLAIHKQALSFGMALKDASAFNIQFHRGRAVHIDTLSFACYREGEPWIAYRQFCQHFLGPLALMAYRDVSAGKMAALFSDGVPVETAAKLLGLRALRRPALLLHLTLQAKLSSGGTGQAKKGTLSKAAHISLIGHLEKLIHKLPVPCERSAWAGYSEAPPYSAEQYAKKKEAVSAIVQASGAKTVWDIGCNDGEFSRLTAGLGANVIALEREHALVARMHGRQTVGMLPLWMDMLAPSAMGGWAHGERQSLAARGPADLLLCLALTHHLAIGGQATLAKHVAVEFVAAEDPNSVPMLEAQPALRPGYTRAAFEAAFGALFVQENCTQLTPTRSLYHYRRK